MNWFFDNLFWLIFFSIIGFFLFRMFRYGGFKAAMFGAPIESTVGEVKGSEVKFMGITLRVHTLGGSSTEKSVGLELVAKSIASYQMMPISLSVSEAKKLIALLQAATHGK